MNIHEYQAKELFKEFGIAIPNGVAVKSENEFDSAIASLNGDLIVVKSQIHAGGRGKGTFVDGFQYLSASNSVSTHKSIDILLLPW